MAAVAMRRSRRLLAAAERFLARCVGHVGDRRQPCAAMRPVAERLGSAASAGTPEVGLSGDDIDSVGRGLRDDGRWSGYGGTRGPAERHRVFVRFRMIDDALAADEADLEERTARAEGLDRGPDHGA